LTVPPLLYLYFVTHKTFVTFVPLRLFVIQNKNRLCVVFVIFVSLWFKNKQ
jgi:hypothetical protein